MSFSISLETKVSINLGGVTHNALIQDYLRVYAPNIANAYRIERPRGLS